MFRFISFLFACAVFVVQALAIPQEFTIYKQANQTGNSITFREKIADLTEWKFFLNVTKNAPYCFTGGWYLSDGKDFEYKGRFVQLYAETEACGNRDFTVYNSIRYIGPEEFTTPAIALYEGSTGPQGGGSLDGGGKEYVVTSVAGNNLDFIPRFGFSFANSSWTLLLGKDFDGQSLCFKPTDVNIYTGRWWSRLTGNFIVGSVASGCDSREVQRNIHLYRTTIANQ